MDLSSSYAAESWDGWVDVGTEEINKHTYAQASKHETRGAEDTLRV